MATDRPALENEEIEITPEMIEAGVSYLTDSGALVLESPLVTRELVLGLLRRCLAAPKSAPQK